MILSVLYKTNKLSWIFIVLVHRKQQSTSKHVAQLWHIIVISSQPVFDLSEEAANTYFIPTIYHTETVVRNRC
jgi:hypothetical protein